MKKLTTALICVFSGALLTLAFAPFHLWPLAVASPALLLGLQWQASAKRCIWLCFWYGLGFYGTSISWVYVSIHVYGGTNAPLAALLTFGFVALLSLAPIIQGYLLACLFPNPNLFKALLGFPATWVFTEWLRSWLLSGFPWVLLGYSQTNSPLKSFAPILGVYGTAFLVCCLAGLCVYGYKNPGKTRYFSLTAVAGIFILSLLSSLIHWTHPINKPIPVSLLQGNIPQEIKWSSEQVTQSEDIYRKMSLPHLKNGSLVVWPESAITAPPWYAEDYLISLNKQAKTQGSTIIVGLPLTSDEDPNVYYNGLLALGNGHGRYFKRHLVPFGEYVPLQNLLRGLIGFFNLPMSDMQPGAKQQPLVIANGIKIATFICYEIAYSQLVYPDIPAAQLMLTMSDDSWFGHSIAAKQHLQIAQWRSLETGRPMLFVSNSGVTAIINDKGVVQQQLPMFTQASLSGTTQPTSGITPIVWMGNLPVEMISLLILLGALMHLVLPKRSCITSAN